MFSTWIGEVLLFAFFGLLALVVIGASPRGNTYEKKRAKVRAEKLQAVRAETTKALTTYAWVDKSKGVVRIPINDAMKLTVAELAQKTPAPADPIAPAATPGAQATAPATASPAASPTASASGTPSPPSAAVKAPVSPSPSVRATPLPVRAKTP
jgi:hypothetical protein